MAARKTVMRATNQEPAAGWGLEESFLDLCVASERVACWLDTIMSSGRSARCSTRSLVPEQALSITPACFYLLWPAQSTLAFSMSQLSLTVTQSAQGACGAGFCCEQQRGVCRGGAQSFASPTLDESVYVKALEGFTFYVSVM